jgi:hypothetical protein
MVQAIRCQGLTTSLTLLPPTVIPRSVTPPQASPPAGTIAWPEFLLAPGLASPPDTPPPRWVS